MKRLARRVRRAVKKSSSNSSGGGDCGENQQQQHNDVADYYYYYYDDGGTGGAASLTGSGAETASYRIDDTDCPQTASPTSLSQRHREQQPRRESSSASASSSSPLAAPPVLLRNNNTTATHAYATRRSISSSSNNNNNNNNSSGSSRNDSLVIVDCASGSSVVLRSGGGSSSSSSHCVRRYNTTRGDSTDHYHRRRNHYHCSPARDYQHCNCCCEAATMTTTTMEGSLSKWTNVVNGWQYRWFVLDDNAGLLSYYTSKEKMKRGARRGCVRLKGAVIGIDDEDDSTFTITTSSSKDDPKTFHFQTRNGEERERWVRGLEDTILRHSHARWDPRKPPPKHDFDRKVAEADAYLQLLIDQIKVVEQKQSSLANDSIDSDSIAAENEEKGKRYAEILSQANAMLNAVKHAIVQLQIAKARWELEHDEISCPHRNTAIPVNGIYRGPTEPAPVTPTLKHVAAREPDAAVQTGIELGSECTEPRGNAANTPPRNLPVPEYSYSSSDEDEDYFDAADEISPTQTTPSQTQTKRRETIERAPSSESNTATADSSRPKATPAPPPIKHDGSIDYDAMYEEESDGELDSMESHGSVVTHLLSQVKIGMDLTKVALPTFILERRSLLEMYADYFAHPDQFVSIADMTSPRERMVQVCKWYLCSFHAGRRTGVAKKPYNPVLGEIFRCFWELPACGGKESSASESKAAPAEVEDGPVPWCNENQLAFVAEQVSHHPPVSAFYAEHKSKRISFGAHVWTKSKFLGLSIGVHNVGKGTVRLHAHDEEYVLTFPNGYARSILTVPWIELGGATSIVCAQTGYQANVDFLTKPFYGGKKNRITCSVTGPADKKPFLVINGDWNGAMEAKWADGRTEVFADVREQKVERKLVKPMSEQEDDESRKVWREVTMGLRINDMDKATAAKIAIEQKQRDDVRYRKDNNISWHTKLFQETKDGGWDYISPLENRLKDGGSSVPAPVDTAAAAAAANTSTSSST